MLVILLLPVSFHTLAQGYIKTFNVPGQIATEIIDEAHNSISVNVHASTDVTALTPTITTSPGTSVVTPASGVPQDFTNAVGYIVDGARYYSVNILKSRTLPPLCPLGSVNIPGDPVNPVPPAATYLWEMLVGTNWVTATGALSSTTPNNYQTANLPNTTNSPIVYSFRRSITVGAFVTYDSYYDITVDPSTPISNYNIQQPPVSTFCGSGTPTINGDPPNGGLGAGTYVYQWRFSTDGVNYSDVTTGGTGQNYTPLTALTQNTWFKRRVQSGPCALLQESNAVKITIQPALGANTIAATGTTTFCISGTPNVTGPAVTGGNGRTTYIWESSINGGPFTPINGATGPNYTPASPITATTSYHRIASSGSCVPGTTSNVITFTVTPAIPPNTIHTPVTEFCLSTGAFTINGDPPAGGNGTYSYQWQSSTDGLTYTNIATNGTSPDYTSPSLTANTWFKRLVSSGACINTSESAPVKITVYKAFAGNTLTAPTINKFCGRGDAGPIVGEVPTGGDGNPQYQWQQSPDNVDAHFTDIIFTGTGKDFDPPQLTSTTFYRRVVKGPVCTTPDVSAAVEIHITPPIVTNPPSNFIQVPPFPYCVSIDPQPISGSPVQGGDPGDIQYKWYNSTDGGANWSLIPGADQIDYDPPTITRTTSYRRDVTSGACQIPVPSNIATITVNQTPPNVTVAAVAPVCAGSPVTLSVTSPDPALIYTWYDTQSRNNVLYQGPSYTINSITASTTFYVDASNGSCNSPVITAVPVTVNALPDVPVLDGSPYTGCKGSGVAMTVTNAQAGFTYNWYTVATGGAIALTGSSVITPALNDNAIYFVEAVNNATGCVSATRTEADITIFPLPVALATGTRICPGTTAVLTANSDDQDQQVIWYDAPAGGNQVGSSSTFITPPLTSNTSYYAEVTNTVSGCVSAKRAEAMVTIITPLNAPVIEVQSSFAPTVTFQWTPVTGATGYQVSTDNGVTFTDPSSGSDGFTHSVGGLQPGQKVTLIVRALGTTDCETSANSAPITATAINPNVDEIFVANAFTPNGDGRNDLIYVRNENIKSLKFYVYSQYGQLLYASQSQQNGWDGTFKGKAQPAGVYVYYLEAVMNDGSLQNKRGTITLIR